MRAECSYSLTDQTPGTAVSCLLDGVNQQLTDLLNTLASVTIGQWLEWLTAAWSISGFIALIFITKTFFYRAYLRGRFGTFVANNSEITYARKQKQFWGWFFIGAGFAQAIFFKTASDQGYGLVFAAIGFAILVFAPSWWVEQPREKMREPFFFGNFNPYRQVSQKAGPQKKAESP